MLEIRPNCEHCGKLLPPASEEAMICSFECTYCSECALGIFENVCPSCGGNFERRPIRTRAMLRKYEASDQIVFKPQTEEQILKMKSKYLKINPFER